MAVALSAGGCDDDDASSPADGDADSDSDSDSDPVANDEPCGECEEPPDCADNEVLTCCVCVRRQSAENGLTLTSCGSGVDDYCGDGPMDLSCFRPDGYRQAAAPQEITVYGVTDVFGNGLDADEITVEVFLPGDGCDDDPGELLSTAVALTDDCVSELGEERCREEDPGHPGEFRNLGYFELPDTVPSETLLAARTNGNPRLWKPIVFYNLYFANEEIRAGRVFYEARVLSVPDYRNIPAAAGIPQGVPQGRGVIAGEIHDCADVRVSFAQVNTEPAPPAPYSVVYFNEDAANPLPVSSRTEGTSLLGLWAAFSLPPGKARAASLGVIDGSLVSMGWFDVCVFADTVTAVTLRGPRAQQLP